MAGLHEAYGQAPPSEGRSTSRTNTPSEADAASSAPKTAERQVDATAQAGVAAASMPPPRAVSELERLGLVMPPDGEWPGRRVVCAVAGAITVACMGLALACLVLERAVMPVDFGASLGVVLVTRHWPELHQLATAYWAISAATAGWFALSTTRAHVEMPGHWRSPVELVHRRGARFVGDEVIAALLFGTLGLLLQHRWNWPVLAAPVQCLASLLCTRALAIAFVPNARPWLRVIYDPNDGIGNRVQFVSRCDLIPRGFVTVNHWLIEYAQPRHRPIAWLFGYASLELGLRLQPDEPLQSVLLRDFGRIAEVNMTADVIEKLRIARRGKALDSYFPQPMTGWSRSRSEPSSRR